ncbi:MAG TPA: phasin family protein [Usitatibacter sp.]|jgi:phasin family protein|nr:phasin family protein [Usitatibacter sp.]
MFKIDQLTAANQAAIEQFNSLAQLSLANAEKLAEIGLGAARESVNLAADHARALATAKDVHEVIALNSAALEPALKRAYSVSREAFETATEAQNEVKRALEKQNGELNRAAVAALEEAFKYAPAGSESFVGNLKSAMTAAQAAYENVTAINKRIYDAAARTVEDGVATAQAATKRTARRSK